MNQEWLPVVQLPRAPSTGGPTLDAAAAHQPLRHSQPWEATRWEAQRLSGCTGEQMTRTHLLQPSQTRGHQARPCHSWNPLGLQEEGSLSDKARVPLAGMQGCLSGLPVPPITITPILLYPPGLGHLGRRV